MKQRTSLSTRVFYAVTFSILFIWAGSFGLQEFILAQTLDASAIAQIRLGFQAWFICLMIGSGAWLVFSFHVQRWMHPLLLLSRWIHKQDEKFESPRLAPPAPSSTENTPPEIQDILEKIRELVLKQKAQIEKLNLREKTISEWEASAAHLFTSYNLLDEQRNKDAEQAIQKESLKQMQEFAKHLLNDLRISFSRIQHQMENVILENRSSPMVAKIKALQMDLGTILTQFDAYQKDAGLHADLLEQDLLSKKPIVQSTLFLSDEISEALLNAFPIEIQEKYEIVTQLQNIRNVKGNVSSHFFQSIIGKLFHNLESLWQESPSYKFKLLLRGNLSHDGKTWSLEILSNASAFDDELIPEGLPKLLGPFGISLTAQKISAQDEVWGYRTNISLKGRIEEKSSENSQSTLNT